MSAPGTEQFGGAPVAPVDWSRLAQTPTKLHVAGCSPTKGNPCASSSYTIGAQTTGAPKNSYFQGIAPVPEIDKRLAQTGTKSRLLALLRLAQNNPNQKENLCHK